MLRRLDLASAGSRRRRWRSLAPDSIDLEVCVAPRSGSLRATFLYATDLLERSTIERLALGFRVLLEAAVSAPEVPLHDLPILTPEERQRILVEWNDTAAEMPADATIDRLFRPGEADTGCRRPDRRFAADQLR